MYNNRNNRETMITPQTIIVPTKSIIVASLIEYIYSKLTYFPEGQQFTKNDVLLVL